MNEYNKNNNPIDLPLGLTDINKDIMKKKQTMLDKEIDNILGEFPVESPKKKNTNTTQEQPTEESKKEKKIVLKNKFNFLKKKQKTNVPKPPVDEKPIKPNEPVKIVKLLKPVKKKFNIFIPITIILALLIIVAVFITMSCDCPEPIMDVDSASVLAISIKDQIITNGYAEVVVGDIILKLAPYTG